MNQLKRTFDLTVTTLAPLHIGTGRELLRDYDYVTHGGKTWVMDAAALLDAFVGDDGTFDERILGRPAAELLRTEDFTPDNPAFRYVLPGVPRSTQAGAVLREQMKDVFGRPYLPGSSIKGALRTILAWHGFRANARLKLNVGEIRSGRSWAGQGLEREIFGRNPNYDLLRALQIGDSEPQSADVLRIVNAQVVTGSKEPGSPIELEAVWQDVRFRSRLTLDLALHEPAAEAVLHFGERWSWLTQFVQIAQDWSGAQLAAERAWFQERNYIQIAQLYGQMLDLLKGGKLGENRFFFQVGWGGGWNSKTIGAPLRSDPGEWEKLLNNKRLSPARMRRRSGDAFPKSRRVVVMRGQPVAPLGWCLAELKERA